jgi:hypothetical protein
MLDIDEVKLRIAAVIKEADRNKSERLWDELDCRLGICQATNVAHIKHLQSM